jgi:hypothetical protein
MVETFCDPFSEAAVRTGKVLSCGTEWPDGKSNILPKSLESFGKSMN